jgi:hypothetical protein
MKESPDPIQRGGAETRRFRKLERPVSTACGKYQLVVTDQTNFPRASVLKSNSIGKN